MLVRLDKNFRSQFNFLFDAPNFWMSGCRMIMYMQAANTYAHVTRSVLTGFGFDMAPYKLFYLNFRGRAEVIRYMFKLKDVEFEDIRMEPDSETWQELKPSKH